MIRVLAVASIVASISLMAGGCAKQAGKTDKDMGTTTTTTMPPDVGEGAGREESLASKGMGSGMGSMGARGGSFSEGRTSGPMLPLYFDFDSSDVRADQQGRMKKNAEFLAGNPNVAILVEGNCDERGTNEYNMALGERRAMGAKKYLAGMGIAESRMETISYGEERPLAMGSDETAWAQNRRADFVTR